LGELARIREKFEFKIHAFVLMGNHYHMLASYSENYFLGRVMNLFQMNLSRKLNILSGRINHQFGGPYRGSLIRNPYHYCNVLKYIYQNPVRARESSVVEYYQYSSIHEVMKTRNHIELYPPAANLDAAIRHMSGPKLLNWLNIEYEIKEISDFRRGLSHPEFSLSPNRVTQKANALSAQISSCAYDVNNQARIYSNNYNPHPQREGTTSELPQNDKPA